jgi:hypothetical protein
MTNNQKHSRDKAALQRIAEALVASGFTSLDAQTKALGLPRSTVWTIMTAQHKVGRLTFKVRARMLANPNLPRLVRAELEAAGEGPSPEAVASSHGVRRVGSRAITG